MTNRLRTALFLIRRGCWELVLQRIIFCGPMLVLKARLAHAGTGFWVERPDLILNPHHIHVGDGFKARRGLRLWAIDSPSGFESSPKILIGNNVSMGYYVSISALTRVAIGDDVLIASDVFITDHNHGRYDNTKPTHPLQPPLQRELHSAGPVIIERCCWIGEKAVILPNVRIGEGSVVAAGAIVTRSVLPYTVVAGAPARAVKRYDLSQDVWSFL